ncbi:MAG TPA: hypothetical protein DDZ51_30075 [Planctomycetaceae bacterium]|nr:hypothetical protein [Planctomycetaceae bacterium]
MGQSDLSAAERYLGGGFMESDAAAFWARDAAQGSLGIDKIYKGSPVRRGGEGSPKIVLILLPNGNRSIH